MIICANVGMWVGISCAIVGVIIVATIIYAIVAMRNNLVKLVNACEEAWATIDVYLKKRYDLIPNLVQTVKGYASHEKDTLEAVVSARNKAMSATGANDKIAAENQLQGCLKSLFALSESYPALKADTQFLDLQRALQSMETDLAQSRKYYNGVTRAYNTKTQVFPSNIVANVMHLEARKYFELENNVERENIKVQF